MPPTWASAVKLATAMASSIFWPSPSAEAVTLTSPWPLLTCSRMALPSRCARARAVTVLVPELTAWAFTVRSALLTKFSVLRVATSKEASAVTLAAARPPRALAWSSRSSPKLTLPSTSISPWAMAEPASVRLPLSWAVIATELRKVTDPLAATERLAWAFTLGDSAPLPAAWLEALAPTARSPTTVTLRTALRSAKALARAPWMPLLLANAFTVTLPPRTMPPLSASSVRLAWALV